MPSCHLQWIELLPRMYIADKEYEPVSGDLGLLYWIPVEMSHCVTGKIKAVYCINDDTCF